MIEQMQKRKLHRNTQKSALKSARKRHRFKNDFSFCPYNKNIRAKF
jgi:hypothetical protein